MPFSSTWAHDLQRKGWLCEAIIHTATCMVANITAGDNQMHHSIIAPRTALITARQFSCKQLNNYSEWV